MKKMMKGVVVVSIPIDSCFTVVKLDNVAIILRLLWINSSLKHQRALTEISKTSVIYARQKISYVLTSDNFVKYLCARLSVSFTDLIISLN